MNGHTRFLLEFRSHCFLGLFPLCSARAPRDLLRCKFHCSTPEKDELVLYTDQNTACETFRHCLATLEDVYSIGEGFSKYWLYLASKYFISFSGRNLEYAGVIYM